MDIDITHIKILGLFMAIGGLAFAMLVVPDAWHQGTIAGLAYIGSWLFAFLGIYLLFLYGRQATAKTDEETRI